MVGHVAKPLEYDKTMTNGRDIDYRVERTSDVNFYAWLGLDILLGNRLGHNRSTWELSTALGG